MSNQGQICSATSRILVQRTIYQKFIARLRVIFEEHSVGDPFEDDSFQGPQITKDQLNCILSYVNSGKADGAMLVTGGNPVKNVGSGKGFYMEPTVFSDVRENMEIYQEEIFEPFAVVTPFETEAEAIRLASNTCYGLGSAIFTKDLERAHRVAARLEAGMVWINSSNDSDFRVPFGGVKQSGIGRELGEAGLGAYSQTKTVRVNIGTVL